MSLNKAIASGKERRKAYRGSRRFDSTCRNNGACTYCLRNRTVNKLRLRAAIRAAMKGDG